MFEEFMQRISKGNLESQRLLVPEAIDADAGQLEAVETHAELLEKLGIEASASGPASISVYALPTLTRVTKCGWRKIYPRTSRQTWINRFSKF